MTKRSTMCLSAKPTCLLASFFFLRGPWNRCLLDEPPEDHEHLLCLHWKPTFCVCQCHSTRLFTQSLWMSFLTSIITFHVHQFCSICFPPFRPWNRSFLDRHFDNLRNHFPPSSSGHLKESGPWWGTNKNKHYFHESWKLWYVMVVPTPHFVFLFTDGYGFPGPVTPSINSSVLPAFLFFNRLNPGFGAWSTDHDGIWSMGHGTRGY